MNIGNKISPLPVWRYIAYSTAVAVTFVDAINVNNNVNNNKIIFSADDRVLIKF